MGQNKTNGAASRMLPSANALNGAGVIMTAQGTVNSAQKSPQSKSAFYLLLHMHDLRSSLI